MRKLIYPVGGAVIGSVIGIAVGLGLLTLWRTFNPPGPMMMGDLESPLVTAIGLILGGGLGIFAGLLATREK